MQQNKVYIYKNFETLYTQQPLKLIPNKVNISMKLTKF